MNTFRKFLLELGVGFSFVASQYPLKLGGEDFKIDLLFYHLKLRCFVVIDLKMGPFKPKMPSQMNFYLSAIRRYASPSSMISQASVWCSARGRIRTSSPSMPSVQMSKPLGISDSIDDLESIYPWICKALSPTVEELEAELEKGCGYRLVVDNLCGLRH